jgi:hypothetical protein
VAILKLFSQKSRGLDDVGNNYSGTHDQASGSKTARSDVLFLSTHTAVFNLGNMDTIFTLRGLVREDTEIPNEMT